MGRKAVAGVAVLALGLALASCGGSSKPLTQAEFARKANAICVHRRAIYAPIVASAHGDFRSAMRRGLPALEAFVRQLSELKPPVALRSAYAEILSLERSAVVAARAFLAGGQPNLQDDGPPLHRHERLRVELGMAACN